MSKLLVVFGATGQQGGSIVDHVINDPELSKQYRVRGVTRDPSKPAGQALRQKGVEVVQGDLDHAESVAQALRGSHTVFVMTNTVHQRGGAQKEISQGKAVADAAVAAGAQYLIFSTAPRAAKISGVDGLQVVVFDTKAEVEEYIRGLPLNSAFFSPGGFMKNFHTVMAPRPVGDGTYTLANMLKPTTQLPLIDIAGDTGKFVGAILAEPDKYAGATFVAATRLYSMDEIAQTISEATGQTVRYTELPEEVFRGFMTGSDGSSQLADNMVEMMALYRDHGYFGPRQRELIEWTTQQARGKLTTLAEYLAKNPINLK
ncbi:uncharacterized protein ACA1_045620 [Acanthamoeba castellanii str. Neff]|uniref:NmrA-like domain-containing protein n=1 Tax=Acanthamoeba castellanii (strain ATCC 30010 / Neff) TaxID=1257118 RepID=L8GZ35_ACACF|nr:uncharacterized protein ACA1_045620 [Acanthamoeba castellanii str. Neff]ELR18519.1 hypothetical protein ACA1_045620 [Acanthamoeba castellanii str. Neff]